ncbi:MAG: replication-relaxation family protein [Aureispira sp.]
MTLQEREINILAYLFRYKYMNTHQIKRLFFEGQTDANMHRILTKLVQLKLIERIRFPKTKNIHFGSLLYLEPRGALCLANEWGMTKKALGFKRIIRPLQSVNHFYHRMRLVDFWIQLDNEIEQSHIELKYITTEAHKRQEDGQYVSQTMLSTKDGEHTLIPDICFVLENPQKGTEVVFFVEIDSGKETIAGRFKASKPGSLLHKYQTYERILIDGGWKNRLETTAKAFLVLTVTETERHIQSIHHKCAPKINYPQLFLLSTHQHIADLGLLFEVIWQEMKGESKRALIRKDLS